MNANAEKYVRDLSVAFSQMATTAPSASTGILVGLFVAFATLPLLRSSTAVTFRRSVDEGANIEEATATDKAEEGKSNLLGAASLAAECECDACSKPSKQDR